MSDVEIEQIRGVNPFRDELPAPPIELVLRRLEREAAIPSAGRRRVRLPSIGAVFVAASVLVTVAVVIVALAALGHPLHRDSAVKSAAGDYPALVQRVVADYAIFRRPQTAADRDIARGYLPEHALPGLVRHVTTRDAQSVFVSLTFYRARVTAWLLTNRGSESSFTPFPLRAAQPPFEDIGGRSLAIVPDSVTRIVWSNYAGTVVTTHPEHNIVYGPLLPTYGATLYAGSRQLDQVSVPVALVRLAAPAGTSTATGEAAISQTNGAISMQIDAHRVHHAHGRYGLWLYSNPGHQQYLGLDVQRALSPRDTLVGDATPPRNFRSYRQLLVTRQTGSKPTAPGTVILEGEIPR